MTREVATTIIPFQPVNDNLMQQNDQLLMIVNQQRKTIQELEQALAKMKAECDQLSAMSKDRKPTHQDKSGLPTDAGYDRTSLGPVPGVTRSAPRSSIHSKSLLPPPRSPCRQQQDIPTTTKHSYNSLSGSKEPRAEIVPGVTAPPTPPPHRTIHSLGHDTRDKGPNSTSSGINVPMSGTTSNFNSENPIIAQATAIMDKDAQLFAKYLESVKCQKASKTPQTSDPCRQRHNTVGHMHDAVSTHQNQDTDQDTQSCESLASSCLPNSESPKDLPLQSLSGVGVKVLGSKIRTNRKGKQVVSLIISVRKSENDGKTSEHHLEAMKELWRIEKPYSDFLALDSQLKAHSRLKAGKIGKLPEKSLFSTCAANMASQRNAAITQYLQNAIRLPLTDTLYLRNFLSTSQSGGCGNEKSHDPSLIAGYLATKEKSSNEWKTKYFMLQGSCLQYYEKRGGSLLGSINILESRICLPKPAAQKQAQNERIHTFIILEPKESASNSVLRHTLRASSDAERIEWVEKLIQYAKSQKTKPKSMQSPVDDLSVYYGNTTKDDTTPACSSIRECGIGSTRRTQGTPMTHRLPRSNSDTSIVTTNSTVSDATIHTPSFASNSSHPKCPSKSSVNSLIITVMPEQQLTSNVKSPTDHNEETSEELKKARGKAHRRTFWAKKIFTGLSSSEGPTSPTFGWGTSSQGVGGFLSRVSSDIADTSSSTLPTQHHQKPSLDEGEWEINRVFGVPLDDAIKVCRIFEQFQLPAIVYRCIEYLEAKDAAREEGIYRLSGSALQIKMLKKKFDQVGDYNLLESREYHDIHVVAGLLKLWLRELPHHVLTEELLKECMLVTDIADHSKSAQALGRLMLSLPLPNYTLLRTLCAHLTSIVQHEEINKMNVRNISIIFSQTLGIPSHIFILFLTDFESVFFTDETLPEAPTAFGMDKEQLHTSLPDHGSTFSTSPIPHSDDRQVNTQMLLAQQEDQLPRQPPFVFSVVSPASSTRPRALSGDHGNSDRNNIRYVLAAPRLILNLEKVSRNAGIENDCESIEDAEVDTPKDDVPKMVHSEYLPYIHPSDIDTPFTMSGHMLALK